MRGKILACLAAVLWAFAPTGLGEPEKTKAARSDGLERFAQLAGDWVGKGKHGDMEHDARVSYKVTSGGSAVVETIDPGGDNEMVTVIHADGDALMLTHYCMLGNQPRMRAKPKAGDNKVAFEFVKATNMKSDKEMHMRSVTYTFVNKDTLRAEWTMYTDGKDAGKAVFEMKRKK
jgi:hypothetical protein